MHIYLLSVTHQINHSTRHLQNVNKCLQISKHAFIAPAFKSSPSRQCALHPPCFVCGCRCPCAAPPVEQRVHPPCPHQRRCRALPRAGAPHGPMCTLRSGVPPRATPCSGTRAVCCWGCWGVMPGHAPTRSLLLPLLQGIYVGTGSLSFPGY